MKITADTNFLISATQWDYSVAHKLLKRLLGLNMEIFTTREIFDEFANILKRDFKYDEDEAKKIVEAASIFTIIVEPKEELDIVKEDPTDNKILACAIESGSEYVLTYDNHLLNIKEFRGIKLIKPEEFAKIIG